MRAYPRARRKPDAKRCNATDWDDYALRGAAFAKGAKRIRCFLTPTDVTASATILKGTATALYSMFRCDSLPLEHA